MTSRSTTIINGQYLLLMEGEVGGGCEREKSAISYLGLHDRWKSGSLVVDIRRYAQVGMGKVVIVDQHLAATSNSQTFESIRNQCTYIHFY
ncbi:hypothetical protein LENED_012846 [Lentinula edodes]|uniref:Uncharacterized protein n=1 Tax=Lentinula edodes TaxID=5353 RepID=A0A1Q3ETY2_LENED|nr:hypothetical protein LENED_012846 [Lentinula edodes]